jgi:hypothetical protein
MSKNINLMLGFNGVVGCLVKKIQASFHEEKGNLGLVSDELNYIN